MFGKKATQALSGGMILLLVIVGIVLFKPDLLNLQSAKSIGATEEKTTIKVEGGCAVTSPTVKFSGIDLYTKGTAVTQGHLILQLDGEYNSQVANAGTKSASVGDVYKILAGNLTSGFTAGTTYYPQYIEGKIECEGAPGITGELAKSQSQANTAFTFWNNNDAANTAQAIGANDEKTVRIRFAASDNTCFGNPYAEKMGESNVMCFTYNSTTYSSIELIGATGANRPKAATAVAGKDTVCYNFPVLCDNAEYESKVVLKTSSTQPSAASHNVSISIHDVTFDYNADTLDLIVGVEDEAKTRNDLGVTDYSVGDDFDYSISVT